MFISFAMMMMKKNMNKRCMNVKSSRLFSGTLLKGITTRFFTFNKSHLCRDKRDVTICARTLFRTTAKTARKHCRFHHIAALACRGCSFRPKHNGGHSTGVLHQTSIQAVTVRPPFCPSSISTALLKT